MTAKTKDRMFIGCVLLWGIASIMGSVIRALYDH